MIELLVNSAGIPGRSTFLRADPELIERVVHTNYLGSAWSVRAFLPGLEAAGLSHVVNVSVAGTVAVGRGGPYSASKHAQLAFLALAHDRARAARDPRPHDQPGLRRDGWISADAPPRASGARTPSRSPSR